LHESRFFGRKRAKAVQKARQTAYRKRMLSRPKSAVMAAVALAINLCATAGSAGEYSVEGLALDFGAVSLRIPRLTVEGAPLSVAQFAQSFQSGDAAALEDRLAGLSASRLFIPEIHIRSGSKDRPVDLVYRDVTLENIVAGRAAAMRAASLIETVGGDAIEAHFSGIEAKGLDLRQIAHVALIPRADQKEAARNIEEEASIDRFSIFVAGAGLELSGGKVSASGLRARPLAEPPLHLGAQAAAMDEEKSGAAGILEALGSFEAATMEARDLIVLGSSGPEKKPFRVTIGAVGLKAYAGGFSREGRIEDFALQAADGGRLAFAGLAFQGLDFVRLAAPGAPSPWIFSSATLADFAADLPDGDSSGRLVFTLAAAAADLSNFRDGLPTRGALRLERFNLDLAARGDTPTTARFAGLGYRTIELSASFKAEWLDRSKEAAIEQARIDAAGVGALELKGRLANVSDAVFSPNPLISRAALSAVTAKRLDIALERGELIDRLLAQEAKASREDPASLRASYARDVKKIISAWLEDGDKARRIGEAAGKFIEAPKRLHIGLSAPEGLRVAEALVKTPGQILNGLEVEAEAQ
jgi:hypothetical protein